MSDDLTILDRHPGGRPDVPIDLDVVERAASIGCTVEEISALVGCSRRTMFYRLKDDPAIQDAIERGRDKGAATLRRHQWQKATAGSDTMLIWLGKQMLGQRDVTDLNLSGGIRVNTPVDISVLTDEQRDILDEISLLPTLTLEGKAE